MGEGDVDRHLAELFAGDAAVGFVLCGVGFLVFAQVLKHRQLAAHAYRRLAAERVGKAAQHSQRAGDADQPPPFLVAQLDRVAGAEGHQPLQHHLAAGADQAGALDVVVAEAAADHGALVAEDLGADVKSH